MTILRFTQISVGELMAIKSEARRAANLLQPVEFTSPGLSSISTDEPIGNTTCRISTAMEPKLSVIIAAHNEQDYIGPCLSAMLRFRAVTMEVIVVDDGSTDQTARVVTSFADPRLKLVKQSNRGPAAARNTGFRHARGDFVLPFDGDDIPITKNWPFVIDTLAADSDAVLAFGNEYRFNEESDVFFQPAPIDLWDVADARAFPRILKGNFVSMGSAFIRRDALELAGLWNESLRIGEDWDLWCRLACLGPFLSCQALVIGRRVHAQSAMGSPIHSRCVDPALMAIEAIYSNPMVLRAAGGSHEAFRRKALAWQTYQWGTRLIRNGATRAGIRALAWSISRDPSRLLYLLGFPLRRLRRLRQLASSSQLPAAARSSALPHPMPDARYLVPEQHAPIGHRRSHEDAKSKRLRLILLSATTFLSGGLV